MPRAANGSHSASNSCTAKETLRLTARRVPSPALDQSHAQQKTDCGARETARLSLRRGSRSCCCRYCAAAIRPHVTRGASHCAAHCTDPGADPVRCAGARHPLRESALLAAAGGAARGRRCLCQPGAAEPQGRAGADRVARVEGCAGWQRPARCGGARGALRTLPAALGRAGRVSWPASPPPPAPRTDRTRLVPPPVLIGHAASLTPY
jgi:hypothetical protein